MYEIFRIWKPSIVYHAAAYKHVPVIPLRITGFRSRIFSLRGVLHEALKIEEKLKAEIVTEALAIKW